MLTYLYPRDASPSLSSVSAALRIAEPDGLHCRSFQVLYPMAGRRPTPLSSPLAPSAKTESMMMEEKKLVTALFDDREAFAIVAALLALAPPRPRPPRALSVAACCTSNMAQVQLGVPVARQVGTESAPEVRGTGTTRSTGGGGGVKVPFSWGGVVLGRCSIQKFSQSPTVSLTVGLSAHAVTATGPARSDSNGPGPGLRDEVRQTRPGVREGNLCSEPPRRSRGSPGLRGSVLRGRRDSEVEYRCLVIILFYY
eukprot:763874-Hanusia_phi.AAC.5